MAVVVHALHHLDLHPVVLLQADRHQVVLAVQVRQVDLHPVVHVLVHPVQVQVLIAMAHHQVDELQVVVTHPIAARIQVVAHRVDRQIDAKALVIPLVEILHDHRHVQVPIAANVALRVDRQIDAMLVHQLGVQMNAGPSVHATHVQAPTV